MKERLEKKNRIRLGWAAACLSLLAAAPSMRAQTTVMDVAGAQLAHAIAHKKQHSVAVLDFAGPAKEVTALGRQLADSVSAAIEKTGERKLRVEDRSQIADIGKQESYAPEIVLDSEILFLFAQDLKVDSIVTGTLQVDEHGALEVELKAYRTRDGKGLAELKITMPMTPEMKSAIAKSVTASSGQLSSLIDFSKKPSPTDSGYKPPRCLSCPHPPYSSEALRQRVRGVVVLTATIGLDGRATNIAVVKGLPDGLTAQSIKALKTWRLAPAVARDGTAVPCREMIMMTFQIFGGPTAVSP
jgi:hypothetical protein